MQKKNFKGYVFSFLALAALIISVLGIGFVSAKGSSSHTATSSKLTATAQKGASQVATGHSMNVYQLPRETAKSPLTSAPRTMPMLVSPKLAQGKAAASHNKNAPAAHNALDAGVSSDSGGGPTGFRGMADSATICPYFGGCQPPDMALGTSSQFVFQGVNTSFALYTTSGHLVAGPTNSQVFFGIPNPSPTNCDPAGPFTSDPRAFYDPNTGFFWAAMLQVEGSLGLAPSCNFVSKYWIANFNPNTGAACVYSFDMALGTTNTADYTQFGFSKNTIAFTGNMFNQAGTAYEYAETQFADKQAMEHCRPVSTIVYSHFAVGTVLLDGVQPVETETSLANDPGVQYLVNSFNINGDPFGDDCIFTACQGFVVWAFDPANGTLGGTLVLASVGNPTYVSPPNADEPGCFQCVETIDTRITGTPVYSIAGGEGLISFSLDTAVQNGGVAFPSVVPGILWGQIQVANSPGNPVFVIANPYQSGYLFFSGDRDASFGAMMQDKTGRLVMVFDTMSANLNPSIMVASRLRSDPLGTIGNVRFILKGPSATFDSRWGDFEAASYDRATNSTWVASQYSVSGDWATFISRA